VHGCKQDLDGHRRDTIRDGAGSGGQVSATPYQRFGVGLVRHIFGVAGFQRGIGCRKTSASGRWKPPGTGYWS
jgi:hypothetical protein